MTTNKEVLEDEEKKLIALIKEEKEELKSIGLAAHNNIVFLEGHIEVLESYRNFIAVTLTRGVEDAIKSIAMGLKRLKEE